MQECICAIDQGTTSTRVLLFDKDWKIIAKHQLEFQQHCPRPGWVDHDPLELLATVEECLEGALGSVKEQGIQIKVKAAGITNQRETTVAWDKTTGKPLHNAIVWFDNRTSSICRGFAQRLGSADYFRERTGLPISTYFSAYKYRWLYEHISEVAEAVEAGRCLIGTIDSWIIWNLTGGLRGGAFVTDVTNASRTNLMDLQTQQWSEELLDLFDIKRNMLADIRSNAEELGRISKGPLAGVPIAGCLGDQQAALLGQSCAEGQAKNTYGTGCFLLLNTGTTPVQSSHGLITTVAYQLGQKADIQYALEGSIAVGGSGVQWLRDNLGILKSTAESETVAASVDDAAGVIFVPAFNGILAPHWRDDARGVILGLTSYTRKAHIVRAMLDAISWQTREVLDAMKDDSGRAELDHLKVDGGACCNDLLMQIQADSLQLKVQRPEMLETTALGAAYAAAIGIGWYTGREILQRDVAAVKHTHFEPKLDPESCAEQYERWKMAVSRSYDLAVPTNT